MSQSYRHVEWCLRKAKEEILECKRLGKRPKHRGLVRVEKNEKEAREHIEKAEENLNLSISLDKNKFGYLAISTMFYSAYHCFLAIAAKYGYESGNQKCTIALVEYLKEDGRIELDEKFIEIMKYEDEQKEKEYPSIIDLREDYTYSAKISVAEEKIENLIGLCRELIEATKQIVYV
jgi:uncharacterized protein (UPF0332 family)